MKFYWAIYAFLARIAYSALKTTYSVARDLGVNSANNRISGNVKKGILAPGDAAPPPKAFRQELLDYRAVAQGRDIVKSSRDFPVGRLVDVKASHSSLKLGLTEKSVNQHTLVLGPTRSGKTASIVAPWIYSALAAEYSVIAIDIKGNDDLLGEILKYCRGKPTLGVPVTKWDYTNPSDSVSWNWISDLQSEGEINAAVEAICGRPSPSDSNKFFHQSAIKYLRGLLQLSQILPNPLTLGKMQELLTDQSELEALVSSYPNEPGAKRLVELVGLPPGEFIKYTTELKTHLEILDTSGFHSVTTKEQFSLRDLDKDQSCVLITAPVADGALSEAASSLFISLYLHRALHAFGTSRRPVLLVLDEAARVQSRIDLPSLLSLVAGAGVSVLLATQDVSQFKEDARDEILANCGNIICLPRVAKTTTDFFCSRFGDVEREALSYSRGAGGRSGRSKNWSRNVTLKPVLGHREIAAPPKSFGEWSAVLSIPSLTNKPIVANLVREDL